MKRAYCAVYLLIALAVAVSPHHALAHAYLDHADPKVGATVAAAPSAVRIWFDCPLQPRRSTISVKDRNGKVVDLGDARVSQEDASLLEVSVPQLPPGRYRVLWKAVAGEGHHTSGDYTFTIK